MKNFLPPSRVHKGDGSGVHAQNRPHHADDEREGNSQQPCNIEQGREDRRVTIVVAATKGHPIEYQNGDKHHDALCPSFGYLETAPKDELREQDRPDAAQQRILVEQEEPEQE